MNYTETVTRLLSMEVEAIMASTASLDLLRCYSFMYLGGAQPRGCENSQRKYYSELSLTGLQKAKEMDKLNERTCKPNWGKGCTDNNGLKFIHAEGRHYSSIYITDEQAVSLLTRGLLNESDFDVLPEGYQKPLPKFEETPEPKKKRTPKA